MAMAAERWSLEQMIRPNLVLSMDSSMAGLLLSAVCVDRDFVKGVIGRWKFKDQVEFLEKLHIKFQNFYVRGSPLARVHSPYLQKIVKRVPGRIAACHHFEEVFPQAQLTPLILQSSKGWTPLEKFSITRDTWKLVKDVPRKWIDSYQVTSS